jgi:hypothetical protein
VEWTAKKKASCSRKPAAALLRPRRTFCEELPNGAGPADEKLLTAPSDRRADFQVANLAFVLQLVSFGMTVTTAPLSIHCAFSPS